ncbi:MAG: DUF3990 domain-containing protein [Bacteroidetes bacterium]|nr:DUF3990 domain-containing protein [Bacteroidota bacterium]MBU1720550.1 DUF3990 domain-containing protein [Bacteroidota bacterium]
MNIYHGSTTIVETPVILYSQRFLDFGKGFYTTTVKEQAERWALIKQKRIEGNSKPIVSVFQIGEEIFQSKKYNVKIFPAANEEWLDFVVKNRKGEHNHPYSLVKGAVANDTLYATLSLFESGILSKKETIKRLKVHKLFDQISFHNSGILKELIFVDSYVI